MTRRATLALARPSADQRVFGFGDGPRPLLRAFHPDDVARRVSFVWWKRGPDDDSPQFAEADGRAVTIVAVWPTVRGDLVPSAVPDVDLRSWVLSEPVFRHLHARHIAFHLGRHDLMVWVDGDRIRSTPTIGSGSVYRAVSRSERAEAAVLRAIIDAATRQYACAA